MKHAFNIILFLLTIFIPTACNEDKQQPTEGFNIVGAWELARIEYPDGRIDTMDVGKYTRCKIYDADSTYYSIELITDGDVVVIAPHEMAKYTLNDTAYIENGRPTPFRIINDTTMTTVWDGYTEVMHKATTMSESRKDEIRGIVRTFFCENRGTTRLSDFVLSTSERELKSDKQRLVYIIVILVLGVIIMTMVIFRTFKQKLLLERNMRELQEIRNLRPEPIANAIKEAETDLFKSEFYQNLHKKIETGANITPKEWDNLEQKLKAVYPDFSAVLYQIHHLSKTEYQVCMLIKIHATPTEMAAVLKREPSTISSLRGRLYHKVFNKKGGAKEWDEFILSL